jgi:DNA-binding helix-hairpin-helix protein with protein kinase domain
MKSSWCWAGARAIGTAHLESGTPCQDAFAARFAYSSDARRTKMAPPPFAPPITVAGPAAAELFERAFHPNGPTGVRPTAEDWVKGLEALKGSLAVCGAAQWHQYASSLGSCPWCAIERGSKAKLFGGVVRIAPAALADVQTLWARCLQIADPGPPRSLPREEDWVPPPKLRRQHLIRSLVAAGMGVAAVGSVTVVANPVAVVVIVAMTLLAICVLRQWPWATEAQRVQALDALKRAEQSWHAAAQEWQARARGPDLSGERRALEELKERIDALASEREARLKALARSVPEAEQRVRYLSQFRIEDAGLHNIGPARGAVLRSWGIETAAEVDAAKIAEIPGFGRNLTDRLVNWRWGREQNFKFMPLSIADPVEVQKLDREIAARRIRLMKELRAGIVELEKRINSVQSARKVHRATLEVAFNSWMLAHWNRRGSGDCGRDDPRGGVGTTCHTSLPQSNIGDAKALRGMDHRLFPDEPIEFGTCHDRSPHHESGCVALERWDHQHTTRLGDWCVDPTITHTLQLPSFAGVEAPALEGDLAGSMLGS